MTTQDKEAVEAAEKMVHECPACGLVTEISVAGALDWKRLPCAMCSEEIVYDDQKNRKQVNRFVMGNPEYIKEATKKLSETIE